MSFILPRFILHVRVPSQFPTITTNHPCFAISPKKRRFCAFALAANPKRLIVVGGGAAGVYGAIRAKTLAPNLNVVVIEKGKPLSKVKISGGGRCNVTNGHCPDKLALVENYPRGNKELRGSFFNMHGPMDTMSWFSDHGVELKIEEDGRVFPVSNSSSSVIDCLMLEAKKRGDVGILLISINVLGPLPIEASNEVTDCKETGKVVTTASSTAGGKFVLTLEKRTIDHVESVEADYLLIASGSSQQGYNLATQLGHSIIKPVPSLFTFKIDDLQLTELSGSPRDCQLSCLSNAQVTFPKVKAKLKFEAVGPMLVTHWGLSGPVILRLSAWGAREFSSTDYKGILLVDFMPDHHIEDVKSVIMQHKNQFAVRISVAVGVSEQAGGDTGVELGGDWCYRLLEGVDGDIFWASISTNSLMSVASLLKQCSFRVKGKISLNTMESRTQSGLFFAGEVLNVDGVTGGFNFQFLSVLKTSAPEKGTGGKELQSQCNKDGGLDEFEPSSVCLEKMVENFMEESNDKPSVIGRCDCHHCNCFNGNCNESSDDEMDSFSCFGESNHSSQIS
ncbi:hypothetical protein RJ639_006941 [Escallonia herrerae]|uniref:FAD/NAD(P)-binding oxidoreductase family protein n=1 Tax=Escallonia herrerae TaxID=1293975 RepID=A0AA88VWI9_9ASTE|nr:hypothetical protein RJ639_006941 [Escallonia herrerae]